MIKKLLSLKQFQEEEDVQIVCCDPLYSGEGKNKHIHFQSSNLFPFYFLQVPDTSSRPQEKFSCAQAQQLVKGLLWSKLEGVSYEAKLCTRLTQQLSEELKGLVKTVCPPRYKMVCVVTLGKKAREDILVASRCLWDPHADSYTSFTYESTTLFCVATVFAVYCE
ncbi:TC1D1 protein, partial [Amia calva]|nr:TC1D1 protein [Amia calva]